MLGSFLQALQSVTYFTGSCFGDRAIGHTLWFLTKAPASVIPKEIMMKKIPGRLCLALLLLAGAANGQAQQRDPNIDPRNNPAQQQPQPDPRGQQRQEADRASRGQGEGARQGRLSPEERQALRRQIDEAGHDIYRTRR
jgi:hypothetical protein